MKKLDMMKISRENVNKVSLEGVNLQIKLAKDAR